MLLPIELFHVCPDPHRRSRTSEDGSGPAGRTREETVAFPHPGRAGLPFREPRSGGLAGSRVQHSRLEPNRKLCGTWGAPRRADQLDGCGAGGRALGGGRSYTPHTRHGRVPCSPPVYRLYELYTSARGRRVPGRVSKIPV